MKTVKLTLTSVSEMSVRIRSMRKNLKIKILCSIESTDYSTGFLWLPPSKIKFFVCMEELEHLYKRWRIFKTLKDHWK